MPSILDYADTRWIGIYTCLNRFILLRRTIEYYCQRHHDTWLGLTMDPEDQRLWDALAAIRLRRFHDEHPVGLLDQSHFLVRKQPVPATHPGRNRDLAFAADLHALTLA